MGAEYFLTIAVFEIAAFILKLRNNNARYAKCLHRPIVIIYQWRSSAPKSGGGGAQTFYQKSEKQKNKKKNKKKRSQRRLSAW